MLEFARAGKTEQVNIPYQHNPNFCFLFQKKQNYLSLHDTDENLNEIEMKHVTLFIFIFIIYYLGVLYTV